MLKKSFAILMTLSILACARDGMVEVRSADVKQSKIIVKFADNLNDEQVREKLAMLVEEYGILETEQLFQDPRSREEIVAEFPDRSQRIPKDVKTVQLKHTYVLTIEGNDEKAKQLSEALTKREYIQYAHPQAIAVIY